MFFKSIGKVLAEVSQRHCKQKTHASIVLGEVRIFTHILLYILHIIHKMLRVVFLGLVY